MTYNSPLHLLTSLNIDANEVNDESIIRVRKKLIADFNLNGKISIKINNKEYTKDEILKDIDKLKDLKNLPNHLEIFKNKKILNWLENPSPYFFQSHDIIQFLKGKEKDEFYGYLIGGILFECLIFLVKKRNFKNTSNILAIVNSLVIKNEHEYHEKIFNEVNNMIIDIEERTEKDWEYSDITELAFMKDPEFVDFLNYLPQQFITVKDKYCNAATNYIANFQRRSPGHCREISEMLVQTECSFHIKELIENNNAILSKNTKKTEESSPISGFFSIISLLLLIIRIAISCSS